jgi:hypothetical protein
MAQISQIIIASGEGSQSKDLRNLRHLREHNIFASILSLAGAFFLSLADGADLADLYDKPMSCNEKICVICAICEKIISLREIIETVVSVRALRGIFPLNCLEVSKIVRIFVRDNER